MLLTALIVILIHQVGLLNALTGLTEPGPYCDHHAPEPLSISHEWQSLGPFRVGTREALWGADPLEAYGGFVNVPFDKDSSYRSPLTRNATLKWAHTHADLEDDGTVITAQFDIHYPDVDWEFLQDVYGWSALQYQVWMRGVLINHASKVRQALIYPENILEFYVNDMHVFGGDFYSFNRAPVLVNLRPGENTINLRMVRDVRAMGGMLPPKIGARIRTELISSGVKVITTHIVAPDLVTGKLPSYYMSVPILNACDGWITLSDCSSDDTYTDVSILHDQPIHIAPGQTRSIPLKIDSNFASDVVRGSLCYEVSYPWRKSSNVQVKFSQVLSHRNVNEAHKFTFMHPSQAVSYAIIKAPSVTTQASARPLLLNLHGAGLEADSDQVRHMLDDIHHLEAFALFPTGMSPWSGDDWHIWGLADVLAAIDAVHEWVKAVDWKGVSVSTERVLVSGHSNGGQGTWFFATHLPDRTLAAVPVSGYTSIENYVSFNMWGEADPLQTCMLQAARNNYKHELLLENVLHTPILQQHGSADDNVPTYHSRLMSSLRSEFGADSDYYEAPGQGHWWTGAMTTQPLQDFYADHLLLEDPPIEVPSQFSLVSPATSEMGYRFGIMVDQLDRPEQLGRAEVRVNCENGTSTWYVNTWNIRRLRFNFTLNPKIRPDRLYLNTDQTNFHVEESTPQLSLFKGMDGHWESSSPATDGIGERTGVTRGALDAILRTEGSFQIISCGVDITVAVQISRNMLQYFGADSRILLCGADTESSGVRGNLIRLLLGPNVHKAKTSSFPIAFAESGVVIRSGASHTHHIAYHAGMGVLFLRPFLSDQLELVVWGYDMEGLEQAARLIPTLTGGGQPDFIVLSRKAKLRGHSGALALGFFDHSWNVSQASYLS